MFLLFQEETGHILANSEPKKLQVEHLDPLLTNIYDVYQLKSNILSFFSPFFFQVLLYSPRLEIQRSNSFC